MPQPKIASEEESPRQEAFDRFSAAVATPMVILTIVMIPVLIIPIAVHHLDSGLASALETADYFSWGVFLFEYLIRLCLAPRRCHFVVHNIPDLIVVAVPMLRPLRIVRSLRLLRILRLSRLTALAVAGTTKSRTSLHGRAVAVILMIGGIALLGVITAAIAAFFVEQYRGRSKSGGKEAEILLRLEAIDAALSRLEFPT